MDAQRAPSGRRRGGARAPAAQLLGGLAHLRLGARVLAAHQRGKLRGRSSEPACLRWMYGVGGRHG